MKTPLLITATQTFSTILFSSFLMQWPSILTSIVTKEILISTSEIKAYIKDTSCVCSASKATIWIKELPSSCCSSHKPTESTHSRCQDPKIWGKNITATWQNIEGHMKTNEQERTINGISSSSSAINTSIHVTRWCSVTEVLLACWTAFCRSSTECISTEDPSSSTRPSVSTPSKGMKLSSYAFYFFRTSNFWGPKKI